MKKVIFLVVLLGFMACENEQDLDLPINTILSPVNDGVVRTGEGLNLVAEFSDNNELLQFKFEIDGIDSLNGISSDSTFLYIYIDGFNGGTQNTILSLNIPLSDSVFNGFYTVKLSSVDAEGNLSLADTVRVQIKNSIDSIPPVFNVSGPTAEDTLGFGDGFSISGSTSDTQSLIYSDIFVGRTNGSFEVLNFEFSFIENNTVDYNSIGWYFQVDSTWAQGDYHLYITSWDNYSGASFEVPFHVSY